ncbi:MAG: autorepressor SdpR family transcription factor [Patescibacteria group bacterium]
MSDKTFKALSDPNRRKILKLLREKDMSVSEMLKHFDFTQASLSHHLDVLKRADLVLDERKGQFVFYSLNVSVFEELVSGILDML